MTQAERSKIDAKEKKAAEQDCFEFLRDLKDVSAVPWGYGESGLMRVRCVCRKMGISLVRFSLVV